jgi:hypothetical protein
MSNCLIFGNGINRCCGGMSWEKLLSKIASRYFASKDTVGSSVLAFEQLRCTVLSKNINVTSENFALDVLNELDNLDRSLYIEVYSCFLSLPIDNILTTNFDYAIERTLIEDYQYDKYTGKVVVPQETKGSRIRHSNIDGKRIFHIHGELGKKGTICLGNVHYATNLSSIMNTLLDYDKNSDTINLKTSIFKDELLSWAQFFFTSDVYIVGLGLYDCDMDLWWLIAYRQQLKLEGDDRIKNKIIYYYLYEQKDQNFKDCLEAMGIEVRELQIENGNWKDSYIKVSENIKMCIGD